MKIEVGLGCSSDLPHTSSASDRLLLRPHRCDNCMSESLLGHLLYCDTSCFVDRPTSSHVSIRSPITPEVDGLRTEHPSDDAPVFGGDLGCSICAKYREAVDFFPSLRRFQSPVGVDVNNPVMETTNKALNLLQPSASDSFESNSAMGLSVMCSDKLNTPVVDGLNHFLDEFDTKTPLDIQGDCTGNEKPPLACDGSSLDGKADYLDDVELSLFEERCAIDENKEDDGSISNDDYFCYCGYCWPFIAPDSTDEYAQLWTGDWAEEGLAMAA